MIYLIDAQLPPALGRWLRSRGNDAVHVAEIGLTAASDAAIAAHAETQRMALISKDEDFVVLRLPDRFAFVWVRCGNATNRAVMAWLESGWGAVVAMIERGERSWTYGDERGPVCACWTTARLFMGDTGLPLLISKSTCRPGVDQ